MTAIVTQAIDSYNASLSVNNQDVSAAVQKVSFPSKWIANDVTAFGSTGRQYFPGIDETKFIVEFMFNQVATTGSHTVVGAAHSGKLKVAFIFYPSTTGSGNTKFSGNCYIPVYEVTSNVGEIVKIRAEFWVDGGLSIGTV